MRVLVRFAGQIKNRLHETGQDVKGLYSAGLNTARIGLIRDRRKRFRASMVEGQGYPGGRSWSNRVGTAWCGPDRFKE
ncbi:MAG TPA: hypothetical protein DCO82_12480 [Alphaproteobacteria bacterium]|nr:hypothetical protein [Alphaproteobacteria bacterium]